MGSALLASLPILVHAQGPQVQEGRDLIHAPTLAVGDAGPKMGITKSRDSPLAPAFREVLWES